MAIVGKVLQTIGSNLGNIANVGINTYSAVSDYKDARAMGNNKAISVGKAAVSFAVGEALGWWMLPASIIPAAAQLGVEAGKHTGKSMANAYNRRGKFGSGYFDMSQAGYTMRQRSLNAIRQNGMNINSTLGNEARTYYRGN